MSVGAHRHTHTEKHKIVRAHTHTQTHTHAVRENIEERKNSRLNDHTFIPHARREVGV